MFRQSEGASATSTPQITRKLLHVGAASALPLLSLVVDIRLVVALAAFGAALAVAGEVARLCMPSLNRWLFQRVGGLFKAREQQRVTGATFTAVATLVAFVAFPAPVATVALLFGAVADPAASLVGARFGRLRAGHRSLEGTAAFLAVALALAVLLWWGGVYRPLWAGILAAGVAALTELVSGKPLPVDDNLAVPLLAGLALTLTWAGQ